MPQYRKRVNTPDPLQKYGIIIGVVLGLVFGLIFGLFIPVNMPFDDCNPSCSFAIDNNFKLSVYNGTDGTPIHEDSDQFECLFSILSIIEFDPVIVKAYQDNATGIPLNETIVENIGTYMSYKNVFIANAKLQLFLTMIFEGINGTLPEPTEDELLELLTPLERETEVSTSVVKPALFAGFTGIFGNSTWLNDPESINITDITDIFNNFYVVNVGFLDTLNPINLAIPEAIESDFFVDNCNDLNFKLSKLNFNMTYYDGLPVMKLNEWNGKLNGVSVSGSNGYVPLNVPALIQFLSLLYTEIL